MGKTSNEAKTRYNLKSYKQVKVSLKFELYDEFKEFCNSNELSYSKFIELALKKLKEN